MMSNRPCPELRKMFFTFQLRSMVWSILHFLGFCTIMKAFFATANVFNSNLYVRELQSFRSSRKCYVSNGWSYWPVSVYGFAGEVFRMFNRTIVRSKKCTYVTKTKQKNTSNSAFCGIWFIVPPMTIPQTVCNRFLRGALRQRQDGVSPLTSRAVGGCGLSWQPRARADYTPSVLPSLS